MNARNGGAAGSVVGRGDEHILHGREGPGAESAVGSPQEDIEEGAGHGQTATAKKTRPYWTFVQRLVMYAT